jgi:hypothetical protein
MEQVDLEFVRKVARVAALAITRFDPLFCGKVIRIAVTASVIELLSAIALIVMWVPVESKCLGWDARYSIYPFLLVAGAWVLWIGVIATFWKTFARWIVEYESLRPKWLGPPTSTALLSVVFASSAAVSAIPFVIILQECGS